MWFDSDMPDSGNLSSPILSVEMENFPRYAYPPDAWRKLCFSVLFGTRRSFRQDSLACIRYLRPPLQVYGAENIPQQGPCLIVFNHYYRPGFSAWWMALALAAVVPQEMHFVMTAELTFPGRWYASLGQAGSRWLLRRLARVYGFTTMPPMPPRGHEVLARARSVRRVLAFVRAHPQAILALAPEGGDQPGGVLNWPPSGAGRFIALLNRAGLPLLPVGIYEADGRLCLNFGQAQSLRYSAGLAPDEKDRTVAAQVMRAIALRLPLHLRGAFDREEALTEYQSDSRPPHA